MMMKLVIAIVQDDDAANVVGRLTKEGFRITKLATTGGFLRAGNTTLLVGVDADKVDKVISIIKDLCETRRQVVTSTSPVTGTTGVYVPYPIEVSVGGATIFVVDVDRFVKI
jgi:uncharacterized protein YaaQ